MSNFIASFNKWMHLKWPIVIPHDNWNTGQVTLQKLLKACTRNYKNRLILIEILVGVYIETQYTCCLCCVVNTGWTTCSSLAKATSRGCHCRVARASGWVLLRKEIVAFKPRLSRQQTTTDWGRTLSIVTDWCGFRSGAIKCHIFIGVVDIDKICNPVIKILKRYYTYDRFLTYKEVQLRVASWFYAPVTNIPVSCRDALWLWPPC